MLENALDTTALQHLYAIRWCNRRWGHIICSLMLFDWIDENKKKNPVIAPELLSNFSGGMPAKEKKKFIPRAVLIK